MHYIFYKTTDVFAAEERLNAAGIPTEIVPNPVQNKAYCGVCVMVENDYISKASNILVGMEYQTA